MKKKIILLLVIVMIFSLCSCGAKKEKDTALKILMYHHITTDPSEVSSVTITADKFEEDMKWLSDNGYTSILPKDLSSIDVLNAPQKLVMITFDDGYHSNYEYAMPILQKYNLTAEVAVITSLTDNNKMFCTSKELKEMQDSGVIELGCHTHNMHNPDNGGNSYQNENNGVQRYTPAEVKKDLETNIKFLTDVTGVKPCSFSYPYGATNAEADKIVNELFDVTFLVTADSPKVASDLYKFRRIPVRPETNLADVL